MARQNINIGTTANDRTGDPLRTAFTKTNANFTELYANVASHNSEIGTLTINVSTLTNDIAAISYNDILNAPTDISEFTDTTNLISASSILTSANDIIITSNDNSWTFDINGDLSLPSGKSILFGNGNSNIVAGMGFHINSEEGISLEAVDTTDANNHVTHSWLFNTDGNIEHNNITHSQINPISCPTGLDTVVYTSTGQYQHAIKLFVIAEGPEGGSWETQACDVIAVKGLVSTIVNVAAYGVTYSGAAQLATFDGRWNETTNRIEITCSPTSLTDSVIVQAHVIEITADI
jgi:hypothetical protein